MTQHDDSNLLIVSIRHPITSNTSGWNSGPMYDMTSHHASLQTAVRHECASHLICCTGIRCHKLQRFNSTKMKILLPNSKKKYKYKPVVNRIMPSVLIDAPQNELPSDQKGLITVHFYCTEKKHFYISL